MEYIVDGTTYTVNVYTKYIKNTCGLFVHNYLTIPAIELEIHPGRFYYGTHHTLGRFKRNSMCVKQMLFCSVCIRDLLQRSLDLVDIWWYPILNCETLTRGLTQHFPLSIQTLLITGIFTTFIMGFKYSCFFIITIILSLMLLLYNNTSYKFLKDCCVHLAR